MSWTVKRETDQIPQNPGVNGTKPDSMVTATWTETAGVFVFKARAGKDTLSIKAFAAAAIKARDKWQQRNTTDKSIGDSILAKINETDPKAGV